MWLGVVNGLTEFNLTCQLDMQVEMSSRQLDKKFL